MLITTLPVTIKSSSCFGTLMSPYIADRLAKFLGEEYCVSVNAIGRRYEGLDEGELTRLINCYLRNLDLLGIGIDKFWCDLGSEYRDFVTSKMDNLFKRGLLQTETISIECCECGVVEVEGQVISATYPGRYYYKNGSDTFCKLCGNYTQSKEFESLRMIAGGYNFKEILPKKSEKEVLQLIGQFEGRALRITKNRPENPSISLAGKWYNIDIDFFWALYVSFLLSKREEKSCIIVTSNRTVTNALTATRLAMLIDPEVEISLLAHPVINLRSEVIDSNVNVTSFLELDESIVLRCFLCLGLNWGQKEVVVTSDLLRLIQLSVSQAPVLISEVSPFETPSISRFMDTMNAQNMQSLLTKLRKKKLIGGLESNLRELI